MMDFIIVIKGVLPEEYEGIVKDINMQCAMAGYSKPIFAHLPADEPAIEIVWTDAEMELKHLEIIGGQVMEIAEDCTCILPGALVTGPHHRDDCPMCRREYQ